MSAAENALPKEMVERMKADMAAVQLEYEQWLEHPMTRHMLKAAEVWVDQYARLIVEEPTNTGHQLKHAIGKAILNGEFAKFAYNHAKSAAAAPYKAAAKSQQLAAETLATPDHRGGPALGGCFQGVPSGRWR